MPRYVAFLRGVSPMNLRMAQLQQCYQDAGFTNVRTIRSSGNAAFDATETKVTLLEKRAEQALSRGVGRSFYTIIRSSAELQQLVAADPFRKHVLPPDAKRVVTFLRETRLSLLTLPAELDGARILEMIDRDVISIYVPGPRGPVFMRLL